MPDAASLLWFFACLALLVAAGTALLRAQGVGLGAAPWIAVLRAAIQLALVALILRGVLAWWWALAAFLLLTLTPATFTGAGRAKELPRGRAAAALGIGAGAVVSVGSVVALGLVQFTPEQLEVLYALAYAHMQQQQWRQALNLFAFLSQYGPTRRHYLAGLAQCLRMAERHEEAINIWTLVLVLFPDNLSPSLHIAQCQLAMGDTVAAQQTLRQLAASLEDSDPLKVRAGALLVQLG